MILIFYSVLNSFPILVTNVPLLLFLKIYLICLKVSQEFDLFGDSFSFSFSFLSLENMFLIAANPFDYDRAKVCELGEFDVKKGCARICYRVSLSS